MKPKNTWDYHVIFLATYLDDNYLCDDTTRWWPEWHEYVLNDNNVPVCETWMLCSLKRNPNLKKYMLWLDSVYLTSPKYFVYGSFNYGAHGDTIKPKQHVVLNHREFLLSFCKQFSIVSPTLSTLTIRNIYRKKERNNFICRTYTIRCNYANYID